MEKTDLAKLEEIFTHIGIDYSCATVEINEAKFYLWHFNADGSTAIEYFFDENGKFLKADTDFNPF